MDRMNKNGWCSYDDGHVVGRIMVELFFGGASELKKKCVKWHLPFLYVLIPKEHMYVTIPTQCFLQRLQEEKKKREA